MCYSAALIEWWDIDLTAFSLEIVLRQRAAGAGGAERVRRFLFVDPLHFERRQREREGSVMKLS